MRDYSGNTSPQFIEGQTFKIILPLIEGLNEGLTEDFEGLNEGLKSLLDAIRENPGIKGKDLAELLNNRPNKTIERQIKELISKRYIERKGSKKTGGYHITKSIKEFT